MIYTTQLLHFCMQGATKLLLFSATDLSGKRIVKKKCDEHLHKRNIHLPKENVLIPFDKLKCQGLLDTFFFNLPEFCNHSFVMLQNEHSHWITPLDQHLNYAIEISHCD